MNYSDDKYSLRGMVFNSIREDILSGRYKEHEELREKTLGEELGVSRTPVREALRQLELEGLVDIIPNRGAFVRGITNDDVKDIYAMRSLLEGLCAKWAAKCITEEDINELEEIQLLFKYHIENKKYEQSVELDNRFHSILYKACGSRILNSTLKDFHHYVERIRRQTLHNEERAKECFMEHNAILDAIKKRDGDLAEKLANEHIMNTFKNISDKGFIL